MFTVKRCFSFLVFTYSIYFYYKCDSIVVAQSHNRDRRQSNCSGFLSSHACGDECIPEFFVCDGITDCEDGSDESIETCEEVLCPPTSFQCAYGACVSKDAPCNGVTDCNDNSDEIESLCDLKNGTFGPPCSVDAVEFKNGSATIVESPIFDKTHRKNVSAMAFNCDDGFATVPITSYVIPCINGKLKHNPPKCLPACRPRSSELVDMSCERDGVKQDCSRYMLEETIVSMKCKERYNEKNPFNRPSIECNIACGQKPPKGTPLVVNGVTAKTGDYPWHVGLYKIIKAQKPYEYQCGGSIISPRVILSAAHCVTDDDGRHYNSEEYYLAAGKFYRHYNSLLDLFVQKRQVEKIKVPEDYRGFLSNYAADIALLIVYQSFEYTPAVQPVCIDWNNAYESEDLRKDKMGTVVGWGYTLEGRKLAVELKELTVPFIERDACQKVVPEHFIKFVTTDKFCSGYTNGSSVCNGDSGGGLVYYREKEKKYYIRGLVSIGPSANGTCDSHQYGAFTRISFYLHYIKPVIEDYSGKCKHLYKKVDNTSAVSVCRNSTWDLPLLQCKPECGQKVNQNTLISIDGTPVKLVNFPWHVGVYRKNNGETYDYLCDATMIHVRIMLSHSRCLYSSGYDTFNSYNIYLAAGKFYKDYDSPYDILVQKRKVTFAEDLLKIMFLSVDEPFLLNNFVRPICLDWNNEFATKIQSYGLVSGWNIASDAGNETSEEYQQIIVPYMRRDGCLKWLPKRPLATDEFCSFCKNGSQACRGNDGSGLVVYSEEHKRYYLLGIVNSYASNDYITYINISEYFVLLREQGIET